MNFINSVKKSCFVFLKNNFQFNSQVKFYLSPTYIIVEKDKRYSKNINTFLIIIK